MSVVKSSISFDPLIWQDLSQRKNRSNIVNQALSLFFSLERRRAHQELEFSEEEMQIIQRELDHYEKTGEYYSEAEVFNRNL